MLGVGGDHNSLVDCTLHVRGSAPYGYGDLFGKGGYKHSGMHIIGNNTRFVGCKIFTRAFGHGYYLQEGAENHYFENCHVEGIMRSTDEMLAETSGLAFDRKFRTELRNRAGEAHIMPGYMKALSEDGFRTYDAIKNLHFKNCTVKNMRGGFELRTDGGVVVEGCSTSGTERGYWVRGNAVIKGCSGDAAYGPLLFVEGNNTTVDVQLLPTESKMNVHAVATIFGSANKITLKTAGQDSPRLLPIMVGYGTPAAGEGMAPIPERPVRGLELRNETNMPLIVGSQASDCQIVTRGAVQSNAGKDISIQRLAVGNR